MFFRSAVISCALWIGFATNPASAFSIASTGAGDSIFASGGQIEAEFLGHSASFSNDLFLVTDSGDQFIFNNQNTPIGTKKDLGVFDVGDELQFRLFVNNTSTSFFTGPGTRNPDGQPHATVENDFGSPGTTLVSFEDLLNGPFNYNDLSFSFSNTTTIQPPPPDPNAVPLPSAALTLLLAIAGLIGLRTKQS